MIRSGTFLRPRRPACLILLTACLLVIILAALLILEPSEDPDIGPKPSDTTSRTSEGQQSDGIHTRQGKILLREFQDNPKALSFSTSDIDRLAAHFIANPRSALDLDAATFRRLAFDSSGRRSLWLARERLISSFSDVADLWNNHPDLAHAILEAYGENPAADTRDLYVMLDLASIPDQSSRFLPMAKRAIETAFGTRVADNLPSIDIFGSHKESFSAFAVSGVILAEDPSQLLSMDTSHLKDIEIDSGTRAYLAQSFAEGAIAKDPEGELSTLLESNSLTQQLKSDFTNALVRQWVREDPMTASEAVGTLQDTPFFSEAAEEIAGHLESVGHDADAELWRASAEGAR